jgi:hypothetical protein
VAGFGVQQCYANGMWLASICQVRTTLIVTVATLGIACSSGKSRDASLGRDSGVAPDGDVDARTSVEGTIGDIDVSASTALAGIVTNLRFRRGTIDSRHTEVVLSDLANTCSSTDVEGALIYIDLFQSPSLSESQVTKPSEFRAWKIDASGMGEVPRDNVVYSMLSLSRDGATMFYVAATGTVTVTHVDEDSIAGSLALDYPGSPENGIEGGHICGSFDATKCNEWSRAPNVP